MKYFLLVLTMLAASIFPATSRNTTTDTAHYFTDSYVADLLEVNKDEPLDYEIDPIYTNTVLNSDYVSVEEAHISGTYASQSTTSYDTYMEAYFRGLRKNFGENYKGSCGYVALGQILSYYDSYLSDHFIDEVYDVVSTGSGTNMVSRAVSPGVLNDTISSSEYKAYNRTSVSALTANEYYNIIKSKSDKSLHANLITIGHDLGYYDSTDNDSPCGTNINSRVNILKRYFAQIGLSEDYYNIRTYSGSSNDVEAWIKNEIDKGNPVLTSVYHTTRKAGHACVLYDYDNSTIYGNMGWSSSSSYAHYSAMTRYDTYRNAMVVEFDFGHEHSLNYQVTSGKVTTNYCYCNCKIYTYKSVGHSYTDHYIDCGDNATHKSYCRCEDYIIENHSWNRGAVLYAITLPADPACKQCRAIPKSTGGGTFV